MISEPPRDSSTPDLVAVVDGVRHAAIPPADRGLAYGDGVFTTIACVEGEPQHWAKHLERLRRDATRLFIPCPDEVDWQHDVALAFGTAIRPARSVLKLILTRGDGRRGYAPPVVAHPRRITLLTAWPEPDPAATREAYRVIECRTRLARNPPLAGIKHLNRLEQVLGAREVAQAGADEGLMFDDRHEVIEATRSNVFIVHRGALFTPPLDEAGVAGVMRSVVYEFAATQGYAVGEARITQRLLREADEIFCTNAVQGLQPVTELQAEHGSRSLATTTGRHLREALRSRRHVP